MRITTSFKALTGVKAWCCKRVSGVNRTKPSVRMDLRQHLLDRFYISDAFYHELTLISDNLPKSHSIKQLRSDVNSLCHIQRTSGKPDRVERDVVQDLKFAIISLQLKNPDCKNVTVKLCGDGTSVARYVFDELSIWSTDSNVSTSACHTVAVVKGQESYEHYKTSFTNVFISINSLFSSKSVEVNGEEIQVNVCMGGDNKFLLMVLGMAGATSNHICIYCKIHTDDRRDMSKAHDFYCQENLARTIEEMSQNVLSNCQWLQA